jgi:hypothetical protein
LLERALAVLERRRRLRRAWAWLCAAALLCGLVVVLLVPLCGV